ncbi:hypothetical protein BH24ACT11_BH24ACT11_16930 [soil metagenome]
MSSSSPVRAERSAELRHVRRDATGHSCRRIFDNEAKHARVQLWASQHHGAVAAIVAAAGLGLGRRAQR